MEPVVRALDVGFGHTKFVSSVDGSEARCAHFPSVAYPTESDETTDPMGGRRKTVGIPIDGLIYEVGPDGHLAADIFNAKQMHERYSETPEYLAMLRGALHWTGKLRSWQAVEHLRARQTLHDELPCFCVNYLPWLAIDAGSCQHRPIANRIQRKRARPAYRRGDDGREIDTWQ